MPLVCNLWPRCRHVLWQDANGAPVEPTIEMLATVDVAVYPWRCQTCADLGYPYYVPRSSHLTNAEIAAETVLRAAQPGDSLKELFSEADMAAFCEAPQDHYHEGPLGGWGPGAGWDPEIPERDMPSTTSRGSKERSSTSAFIDDASFKVVKTVSSTITLDDQPSITMALNDRPSTNVLSRESPSKSSFHTTTPTTSQHHEVIHLASESEKVHRAGPEKHRMVDSTRSSRSESGHHFGVPQGASGPFDYTYPIARPDPLAMVAPTFRNITATTSPSDTLASATSPLAAAAASPSDHAPVTSGTGSSSASATVGLTLVVGGVTYPRIENGKERWYTQRSGHKNNYSRYSDLAKFDTSKGIRIAPKASRAQLEAARRYRTFG
ncbi:hypothetical protein KCU81_g2083, partial [Aureobasidium melanogenum]|uniref:Uncharacterized protein n=1 Tax=Aureobasidium melanogenum (strain CBS 110374) TaxID=1043003 RepID=A0A074VN94_AURM1